MESSWPPQKIKIPIIPVALNTPIWIDLVGVETPEQADGLMKIVDAERGSVGGHVCPLVSGKFG